MGRGREGQTDSLPFHSSLLSGVGCASIPSSSRWSLRNSANDRQLDQRWGWSSSEEAVKRAGTGEGEEGRGGERERESVTLEKIIVFLSFPLVGQRKGRGGEQGSRD
jgi:hypothetical protein